MISDENLAQLKAMMTELLDARFKTLEAKVEAVLNKVPSAAAIRMRRYRVRNALKKKRNGFHRGERNDVKNERNGAVSIYCIPLADKTDFAVPVKLVEELESAYPAVDIPSTMREIRAWCVSNPKLCKTARGAPRFINTWFAKLQNG